MEYISLICCIPTTNPITAPLMKHSHVGTTHDQGIVTIPHAYYNINTCRVNTLEILFEKKVLTSSKGSFQVNFNIHNNDRHRDLAMENFFN